MARLKIYSLIFFCVCAAVLGQSAPPPPSPPVTVTVPDTGKHNTTTSSSTTPSTTTSSSTTPSTTTSSSTTPSTTTTTTTVPPPPTPTPPPPTPTPGPPQLGNWTFTNTTNNVTCIILQFAATLNVTYNNGDNGTIFSHTILNVPANAKVVNGSCGAKQQYVSLVWPTQGIDGNHTLTLEWTAPDDVTYHLSTLNATVLPDNNFPNATWKFLQLTHVGSDWAAPARGSYRCSELKVNLTETYQAVATLSLTHLQEEAFRRDSGHQFSAAVECGSRDMPDAVPIAVGCALGALVLLVLGAYLYGRRRAQAPGYLSM